MNHVFRTIWSSTLGTWVVASELATQRGKGRGADKRPRQANAVAAFYEGSPGPWPLRLVTLAALLALYTPTQAADRYWDVNSNATGMGGAGFWNLTAQTWDDGTVHDGVAGPYLSPWSNASLDTAVFMGTAGLVTLGAPVTVGGLTFNVGGYTIGSSTLTLGGAAPTIAANSGTSTISSVIAGSAGLTKTGVGQLDLTGANTFTGTVTVNQGTLNVANDASLGAAGNGITAASGTSLNAGTALGSRVVTLTGPGQTTINGGFLSSRLTGTGGVSSSLSPTNTLNDYTGRTVISTGGSISFGSVANLGQASAFGAPTDPTLGTIDLRVGQGSGSNQFSKSISYTGGAATSNRNWNITPGIFNGAQVTFANNGSGTLNLTGNFLLTAVGGASNGNAVSFTANTADMVLSGVISSGSSRTVGLNASAGRTLTLGNANTFAGTASIGGAGMVSAGTLANSGTASSVGAGSNISISGNLSYTGGAASIDRTITGAGGTFRNDGTGAFTLAGPATLGTGLSLGGTYTGSSNTLSGAVSGAGFLGSSGPATWTVTGDNTAFTGSLNVSGGTLRAGSATAFGSGTLGGITLSGGTLDLNGYSKSTSNLSGTGGTLALGAGDLTVDSATNTSFAGGIAGTGGLTKLGIGTLTLAGANTYSGATTIGGGTLALDFSNASAPPSNIVSSASTLNMQGGTLRVTGSAGTANAQAFNGLNVLSSNNTLNVAPGIGGSVLVDVGAISYSGGLLNFSSSGSFGSTGTAQITTSRADGTLGGWATINGTDYARVLGGYIVPFTSSDYVYKDNAANWNNGEILSDGGDTGTTTTAYYGALSGTRQIGGLQYVATQNSTVDVGTGNVLGVDGTIVVSSSVGAATQTISGGSLTGVTGGGTLGIAKNGTGAFTVNSTIVDNGGATGFAKSGTGTLVLNSANTYTGATTVSQGTLSVSSIGNGGAASGIGASSADSSNLLLQGATLRYTGTGNTTDHGFTLSTNGSVTDNTVEVTDAGADLRFDGQVVSPDGANLIVKGPGRLTLGNAANTYSGTTTIDGGTLAVTELVNGGTASSIGTSNSAPSSLVMRNGGTLAYLGGTASSDRGFTLDTSGGIGVANPGTTLTMSGTVAGTAAGGTGGAFTKSGDGTLLLSGTNTYSGGTTLSAGTLRAGSARAFGTGPIAVNSGATLDIADIPNVRAGGLSGTGTLNLGVLSSTRYTIDGNGSTFGGIIAGAGGVTLGTGAQTFSGCQHTYAGPTTIWGTLAVSCLPNGGVASDVGRSDAAPTNLVLAGGTLNYLGGNTITDRGFTTGGWISVSNAATTLTFAGQATGGGALIKSGPGTLVLTGTNNNYTGETRIPQGTLRAGATNAFGTASTAGGMTLGNAAGALLDMNGFDTTVAALAGGGVLGGEVQLTDKTLTIRGGGSWIFSGAISGTGNLVKNGPGSQYLLGCASTYTGTTTINAGVLSVDCLANGNTPSAIGASDSTAGNLVLNGGTLAYTGTGGSTDRQFTMGGSAALDASGTGAIAYTSTAAITLPGTAARTLTLTGTNSGNNSLAALITDSGTGATSLSKTGTGTWILRNPGSTYTGVTTITGGGVLAVDKLADGNLASSIGASGNAASNLVIGTGSTLRYTGAGDSTDRRFTLLSGSTFIESSGAGPINLTNTGSVTLAGATAGASGSGLAHVVNLGGTNTDTNIFGATLTDAGTGKTTLSKNGTGLWILTGNNTFTGDSIVNQGNLMVGNGGTSGNVGAGNVYVTNPDSTLSVNRSDTFTLAGTLIGAGTLAQVGAGTTVLTSTGSNIGNTTVRAGTLQVNGALTTASLAMSGTSALTVNGTVQASGPASTTLTGDAGASTFNVNSGGTLRASGDLGDGTDTMTLAGALNTGGGSLNLGTGNDTLVLNDGGTIAGVVNAGTGGESGAGDALQVNTTVNRVLDGAGTAGFETLLKQGSGTLTLTGTQSYSAGTTVQAGTLLVNGNQAGAAGLTSVQSGATLGGTGTVAGDVTLASGAALSPGNAGAVGAFTINGNLTLDSSSALNYQFGQANVPGGPLNDLTTVHGNLTLGGLLNVNQSSGGSFTPGVYRVINYGGALTNNGLAIGSAPAGTYAIQTSVANQVNLVNSTGVTLNFWDGPGHQNDGTIQGGNGLWQNATGGDSWTDQTGMLSATYADGAFAIFGGTAGTVTVDNSLGTVRTSGMQFTVNGYTIDGGPLTLNGAPSNFRVGEGTSAGAGMTATIDAALVGTGGLQKSDLGTLVLEGANTYTGGTTVNGGTLQVASDANLGDASGGLTLDGGALRNTAAFASARAVTLGTNGGSFETQANLALSGMVGGPGALIKSGGGTLTLTGSNTYGGGTFINGGTVSASGDANLGNASGALSFNGGTLQSTSAFASARAVTLDAGGGTFQTTGDLMLTGAIGGSGALTKTDAGTLVLAANNTYAGGTTIAAGTLQLGNGGTTGSITGNVTNNGVLAFDRSNTYSFGGTISGSGAVTQQGSGITVLTGNNSYAGSTAVDAGTLIVNGNQSAAAAATSVAAGATLGGAGTIGGDVSVADGATLSPGNLGSVPGTLAINGDLVLGNASTLSYNFGQANVIGGAYNDLTRVAGDLTLGGTLNVTTTPGATFDPGIYRVISYGGTLTHNGLVAGTMPSPSFYVQTSVNNQVNLVNAAGLPVNFWDGPGNQNDGVIQGGTGLWQNATGNGNWTLGDGGVNAPFQDGSFAIFAAAPGTVTVDNSLGAVRNGGMQFAVDGYRIEGGAITLTGAPNILRVGDGTADGAAMTATIASALTGTGGVQKADLGTLVLTGANSYAGGTTITAGTLQLGDGGASGSILGDVANDGALAFKRSDSTTFSGAISGSGTVTQAGTGTTALTGTNTYLGTTNVQAGTLLVNGDQSGATGLTTVQGGATLGGTGTVGGDVAIAGGATLSPGDANAAGTLTVNGNLSLDSGSTLNYRFGQAGTAGGALNDLTVVHGNLTLGGTLNVSAAPGGSFGPGVYRVFSYDGALTDNGLALGTVPAGDLFVQKSIAHQVNLVNTTGLTLNFWDGPNAQGDGVVNGGDGTWRLADNDRWTEASGAVNAPYSNGAFTVMAGTPGTVTIDNGNGQVEASGLQFAVDGYRLTGGPLALVGSTPTLRVGDGTAAGADMTATVDAVLAGTGTLTKTDLGTLVLNASNTYTGGTTISAGTLRLGDGGTSGSIAGDVTNSGTLAFNRSDSLDFGGAISGTGAIRQIGTGLTRISGNSAGFSGTTTVEAGSLAVDGVLGGTINVLAAGRLQGSGTVGSLAVAGTIAPGNSIGTLTVNGNFTQGAGSTYQVEVDPASTASDLIHAGGTASIASGAKLSVARIGSSDFVVGNSYTVLTADGGVSGAYSLEGDTRTAFVQLRDSYDANNVYLSADKVRSFTEVAATPNQVAVATALDSLPEDNALSNAVAFLPSDFAARDALNQLSVDIHASAKTAMLEDSRFVREAAIDRLRTATCAPGSVSGQPPQQPPQESRAEGCTPADNQARTTWGQVFGSWGDIDGNGNAAELERDIGGFVVGADTGVGAGWRVGGLAGYSRASADTDARNSSAKTDSYHLGVYGATQWGATALRLGASQSWNKLETSRSVAFAGFADSVSAKYDSTTSQLFGEVGHRIDAGTVALEPFAGLAHVRVKSDAFFERGGLAALYGDGGSVDATFSTLGVRASTQVGERTRVRGLLGWRHAFGDTTPTSTHAFGGSLPFTLSGVPLAKNVAVLEAGVETQLRPNLTLGASYSGQFGDGLQDHGFKVNLNWAF